MKWIGRLLFGPHRSRETARSARHYAAMLDSQLAAFDNRFLEDQSPPDSSKRFCASPIFILSAGWRSGSTLLQRMVMANNPSVVIWGEPYDIAAPVPSLADQLRPFSADWPPTNYFAGKGSDDLSNEWVANLYPPAQAFRAAHLAYLETLFAEPAQAMGRSRWGLKEVRLGADHVRYLRWLYPEAKFVFLIRNPMDAYNSYRGRLTWFTQWPDKVVATPFRFGAHWRRLSRDFLELQSRQVGLLVHYESLGENATVSMLADYLGWRVPRPEEMSRLKGWEAGPNGSVGGVEKSMLLRGTGKLASDLGYG